MKLLLTILFALCLALTVKSQPALPGAVPPMLLPIATPYSGAWTLATTDAISGLAFLGGINSTNATNIFNSLVVGQTNAYMPTLNGIATNVSFYSNLFFGTFPTFLVDTNSVGIHAAGVASARGEYLQTAIGTWTNAAGNGSAIVFMNPTYFLQTNNVSLYSTPSLLGNSVWVNVIGSTAVPTNSGFGYRFSFAGLNPTNFNIAGVVGILPMISLDTTKVLTNNETAPVVFDAANAATNTFGGKLTILGNSIQEGTGITTPSLAAHSEGTFSVASGVAAHAEGNASTASGASAHAEGQMTIASGLDSHAAGSFSNATNDNSYVWSDGTTFGSLTNQTFSVYARKGISLQGGVISGNGGGLTNLQLGNVSVGSATNAAAGGNIATNSAFNFNNTVDTNHAVVFSLPFGASTNYYGLYTIAARAYLGTSTNWFTYTNKFGGYLMYNNPIDIGEINVNIWSIYTSTNSSGQGAPDLWVTRNGSEDIYKTTLSGGNWSFIADGSGATCGFVASYYQTNNQVTNNFPVFPPTGIISGVVNVDPVGGNDSYGNLGYFPFKTVGGAIAAYTNANEIAIGSGTLAEPVYNFMKNQLVVGFSESASVMQNGNAFVDNGDYIKDVSLLNNQVQTFGFTNCNNVTFENVTFTNALTDVVGSINLRSGWSFKNCKIISNGDLIGGQTIGNEYYYNDYLYATNTGTSSAATGLESSGTNTSSIYVYGGVVSVYAHANAATDGGNFCLGNMNTNCTFYVFGTVFNHDTSFTAGVTNRGTIHGYWWDNGKIVFSDTITGNTNFGIVYPTNTWNLSLQTNGMNNFQNKITISNTTLVDIFVSNGIALIYPFAAAGGGVLP